MVSEKPAMGRRKIKIEKISKKNHLQVTFSKRRAGLFKKASELSTICGVDIAVIVFSPAQKAFSFGHPDVDSITRRFLSGSPSPPSSGLPQLIETRRNANAHDQNVELTRILVHIEAEKKYGEVLDQMRRADRSRCCWESPIEELEQLRGALEELKKTVARQVNNILIEPTSSLPFLAVNGGGEVGDFVTYTRFLYEPITIV
ncbi:agamous MADS-box protein [Salix suchowensis]|nr:agamous MADS-box protein [Salix suchowensis]